MVDWVGRLSESVNADKLVFAFFNGGSLSCLVSCAGFSAGAAESSVLGFPFFFLLSEGSSASSSAAAAFASSSNFACFFAAASAFLAALAALTASL